MDDTEPPEEVFTDQSKFLNAIHNTFLTVVHPIESGLVDHLRSACVFDSEDEDNIMGEKTRKNKARKCWSLLARVPPGRFHSHCIPALTATCSLAVQRKTFRWDGRVEECVYHLYKRTVPLRRFADMFPGAGACTHEEYRMITEGSVFDDDLWDLVFQLCTKNKDNSTFRATMTTTLKTLGVPLPEDLQALLAGGFPCTCMKTGRKRKNSKKSKKKKKKIEHMPCNRTTNEIIQSPKDSPVVATEEQRATSESATTADAVNNNTSGGPAEEETTESEEEDEDCAFESTEQKETFLRQLEDINKAIPKASGIKAMFHEVSGIKMELSALKQQTRREPSDESRLQDTGKTHRLHTRIRDIWKSLQGDFEEASRIMKETEEIGSDTQLPFKQKKTLLKRRQLLATELAEAERFYNKSHHIFNKLNLDCSNQLQLGENSTDTRANVSLSAYVSPEAALMTEQEMDEYTDGDLLELEFELFDITHLRLPSLEDDPDHEEIDTENQYNLSGAKADEDVELFNNEDPSEDIASYFSDADFNDGENDTDFNGEQNDIDFYD